MKWNPSTNPSQTGCSPTADWSWNNEGTKAHTEVNIGSDTAALCFLSKGASAGNITFQHIAAGDDQRAYVGIEAIGDSRRLVEKMYACLEHVDGMATVTVRVSLFPRGVSGVVPKSEFLPQTNLTEAERRDHLPRFNLTVVLPKSASLSGVDYWKEIRTNLPLFEHRVKPMPSVYLEKWNLTSANLPITVEVIDFSSLRDGDLSAMQALNAREAVLQTLNAGIFGRFNVSSSLVLETANGPIQVNVDLRSNVRRNTTLRMSTLNGAINANVSLYSTLPSGEQGTFSIHSRTANARSATNVLAMPVDAQLALDTKTLMGDIAVKLPAAFEGEFDVRTLMGRAQVDYDEDVEDPAQQQGRQRSFKMFRSASAMSGSIEWRPRRERALNSTARVSTTMGHARLAL